MLSVIKRLPPIRQLAEIRADIRALRSLGATHAGLAGDILRTQLLQSARYADPRHLNHYEGQVFSQNGEDGIISEIFSRIGTTNKRCVEVGVGDGMESNTTYLVQRGWSAQWFDCEGPHLASVRRTFAQPIADGRLRVTAGWLTRENAAGLLHAAGVPTTFDLLSLDVDRNTSFLWRGLSAYRPRVVVIEYNSSIPPHDEWEVDYAPDKTWFYTNYFGASLKSLELYGASVGYALVGCDLTGINAFFVLRDEAERHFLGPFTAEQFYEPPRLYLVRRRGHPPLFHD
jgi:hypothetical protein